MFHVPEKCRVRTGQMGSDKSAGNNGAFFVPVAIRWQGRLMRNRLLVIASDGEGWEHASASLPDRCPVWEEMCAIKDVFWDEEDAVAQYHPPKSTYVNCHPFALHLWRPTGIALPLPPAWMVGPLKDSSLVS